MIADVDYSLIEGGEADGVFFEGQNNATLNWGNNNLTNSAAMFNDLPNRDYTLSQYAQAIGTADPTVTPQKTYWVMQGHCLRGSTPDMGAFESSLGVSVPKPTSLR